MTVELTQERANSTATADVREDPDVPAIFQEAGFI
jgi:hypothetical protein